MADLPLVVVGAGVVGLAVAARLAPRFPELVVLERRARHGTETSSRNSEVIHGGMYYPTGSLKARLCVRGNPLLYELCERLGVPHRRVTKLIVATSAGEVAEIERIHALGRANGVALSLLGGEVCRALEPAVPAVAGLFSPTTGIVSAHDLMDALLAEARRGGATLSPRAELVGLERRDRDYRLEVRTPDGIDAVTSERVVNAAGLDADRVAALAGIDVAAAGYQLHWWKGSYFAVSGSRARITSRLVYPVPTHVSLGVHAVLGLDGRLRFGPDAEYLADRVADYRVDEAKLATFGPSVRRLFPEIGDADLTPDIAGIRPKLQPPGGGFRDWVIVEESARGLPGLVNLVGIESPGLTSALAIAEDVERLLTA
ncbi:MAG TPA: NAD(P)/FAD-dependent oxidoreductase [Kofleriaceae bacterium]|nr:NAD(P)/FAD-dependent oxidoreductase [Kofleriaceae bacterium]